MKYLNLCLLSSSLWLSSCAGPALTGQRSPSSVESCNDIATSLVLSPKERLLEKFRVYLAEQNRLHISSDLMFKDTLEGEERRLFSEVQYKADFSAKMDAILAARGQELDEQMAIDLEKSFIEFMKGGMYTSADAALRNYFPGSYSVDSFRVNKVFDKLKSDPDFNARMQMEYDRIEEELKNPAKTPLMNWLDEMQALTPNFKTVTSARWKKMSPEHKDSLLNLAVDLDVVELQQLKILVSNHYSISDAAGLGEKERALFESARQEIMREFDDLLGDNQFIEGSESFDIQFIKNAAGDLFGARFSYRALAKDADGEEVVLENSGSSINFDSDGKLLSDPGNMAPVPQ